MIDLSAELLWVGISDLIGYVVFDPKIQEPNSELVNLFVVKDKNTQWHWKDEIRPTLKTVRTEEIRMVYIAIYNEWKIDQSGLIHKDKKNNPFAKPSKKAGQIAAQETCSNCHKPKPTEDAMICNMCGVQVCPSCWMCSDYCPDYSKRR